MVKARVRPSIFRRTLWQWPAALACKQTRMSAPLNVQDSAPPGMHACMSLPCTLSLRCARMCGCRNGFLFTELAEGGISMYYEPHCECATR